MIGELGFGPRPQALTGEGTSDDSLSPNRENARTVSLG